VDPLLDGSYSDSADSNGKHGSAMMLHRDFDRFVVISNLAYIKMWTNVAQQVLFDFGPILKTSRGLA